MIIVTMDHYVVYIGIIGTTCIGIVAGMLGVFALVRKQSLLGDMISHAALPGIASMILIAQTSNPLLLFLGGVISSFTAIAFFILLQKYSILKTDAILGVILSTFFGLGILLISVAQKLSLPHQSLLNKFFFGTTTTILISDLYYIIPISVVIILCIIAFWKEFVVISFDPYLAHSLGFSRSVLDFFMISLLVVASIIGLHTIGIILMSSMLIAPAAAARQWTSSLRVTVLLAALFGAFSSITGCILSRLFDHMPTGPLIVIAANSIVFFSFLFSPISPKNKNIAKE